MFGSGGDSTARKLKTGDRQKLRAEAEAQIALAPPSAKPPRSTAALLNEELRRSKLELEEAHARQVDLYDFAPVGYVTLDGNGVIINANLTAATLLGVERGSLLRQRFPGFVAGVDGERWHRAFAALLQCDGREVHRLTLTRGDGATFDADVVCERRSGHDGIQVRIILTDVTEIARIERESHETKERLSLVIDSTGSGFTDWDIPVGRVKYSKHFANMLGYDLGELEPTVATWERLVHPEDWQRCWDAAQPHLRGEAAHYECEVRLRHRDGRWLWTMLRAKVAARDAGGAPVRVVGTHTDITDRKRSEEAVRRSDLLFREVARQFPGGLLAVLDADLRHVLVEGEGLAQFGEVPSDRLGRTIAEVFEPEILAVIEPMHRAALAGRASERDVSWQGRVIRVKTRPIEPDEDGRPRCLVVTQDVTEQTRAAEALQASEAKYRGLFDSLMDGFVVVGMDGFIRESNEVYRKMLGYSAEELKRITYRDLTPERWHPVEARIVADQVLPRGYSEVYEKEYRRKDGTVFPVELRTFLMKEGGRPVAMWAIIRDVTEVHALQTKLAVASRMAALGTLVSGVSHEINNPLAAEMADQGLALEVVREVRERLRTGSSDDGGDEGRALDGVVEALEDAMESGERIARIVRDLTVYGRPGAKRERARLMDVVDGTLRWLPATVARLASIQVEGGGAPDVIVSAGQIEQILVNLVTNAAKATPEGKRDTVIVRVGPGLPGMARLEVIDHGIGIDPAIRDRIFDPFFTTRPVGPERGTGLGLAICQAIATSHGGTLTFESEVGKGSTFRVELPAAPEEA